MHHARPSLLWLPALALSISPLACSSRQAIDRSAPVIPDVDVRGLAMFDGDDGRRLNWSDLIDRIEQAEVIIIGEQHDDAVGHALQQAVVEDALRLWPGTAISMEMLERDEQHLVDDFLDDVIDAETLAVLTRSANWGGPGGWPVFYQPMIDTAGTEGAAVIAANAPRRYAKLARTDGYERLEALPPDRRALVDLPLETDDDDYRQRFFEVMGGHDGEEEPALDDEELMSYFRGQQVWDATMARSIAEARGAGTARVIHLVGQFHSDFDGGTVQQLQARVPEASILVISMQNATAETLRAEDVGRADVVVYTGR